MTLVFNRKRERRKRDEEGGGNAVRQEPWEKWRVSKRNMRSSREKPQGIVARLPFVREFGPSFGAKFEISRDIERSRDRNEATGSITIPVGTPVPIPRPIRETPFIAFLKIQGFYVRAHFSPSPSVVPRLEILSSANFYAKRGVRDGKKTVEERGSFSWETRAVIAGEREQRAYSLALIPFDLYLLLLPSLSPFEF